MSAKGNLSVHSGLPAICREACITSWYFALLFNQDRGPRLLMKSMSII